MLLGLVPHQGVTRTGEVVTLPQYKIMLGTQCVGYVGMTPGAPINLIVPTSEGTKEAIQQAVLAKLGSWSPKIAEPPPLANETEQDE